MKKFFALFLSLAICLTFSAMPAYARVDDFTESDYPQIFEMKLEEIDDFYLNSSYEDLISEQNAYIHDDVINEKPVKAYTIAFLLSDYYDVELTRTEIETLMNNLLNDILYPIYTKYFGVVSVNYDTNIFRFTQSNPEKYYHYVCLTINLIETPEQTEKVLTDFVRPFLATLPSDMTVIQKIAKINEYILNGQFSYDTDLVNRKSVYQMVFTDKKGVCEEYAGLSKLFFDELGLENLLIYGTVTNNEAHVWNLVKINNAWYNSDMLWDGPVDSSGQHTDVTTDYLLKSTSKFSSDHHADAYYEQFKSLENIDESLFNYVGKTENPNVPKAPVFSSLGSKYVKLVSEEGLEYSKDGVNWQASNEFTGLNADTEYSFYARYAENNQYKPSAPSQATVVRTNKAVNKGDVTGDNDVTLADAMIGFRCLAGSSETTQNELAAFDLNGNGIINLSEIMKVFLYVSGKVSTL